MAWGVVAAGALGALGGLLGRKKKMPDLSTLGSKERKKVAKEYLDWLRKRRDMQRVFSPAQINAFLGPAFAKNASNLLSSLRLAQEASIQSGQGARSGTLMDSIDEAMRSRTAADRMSTAEMAQLEARLLPALNQQAGLAMGEYNLRDAELSLPSSQHNANRPSALAAALTGAAGAIGGGGGLGSLFGGGGGNSILAGGAAQWDPKWSYPEPNAIPPGDPSWGPPRVWMGPKHLPPSLSDGK